MASKCWLLVTDKSLTLSKSQFSHLQDGDNNCTFFVRLSA
jgi:hypothetical protein